MDTSKSNIKELTREQLYDLVWSKPSSQLAKEFGFSDVMLKKVCRKYNVPKPGVGYWAALRAGVKMERTPLPSNLKGESSVIISNRPPRIGPPKAQSSKNDAGILVSEELNDPHPLIKGSMEVISKAGIDSSGFCVIPAECISVYVSRESLDRAMRILDALIKALLARNALVTHDAKSKRTFVEIKGEKLSITLKETAREAEAPMSQSEKKRFDEAPWLHRNAKMIAKPSGDFIFEIHTDYGSGFQKTWSDSGSRRLERLLNGIVSGLWRAAESSKIDREVREARQREWKEQEKRREERQRREEEERNKIQILRSTLALWERRNKILQLVDEVEQRAVKKFGSIENDSDISKWLSWAKSYCQSIDLTDAILDSKKVFSLEGDYWAKLDRGETTRDWRSYSVESSTSSYWNKWWRRD